MRRLCLWLPVLLAGCISEVELPLVVEEKVEVVLDISGAEVLKSSLSIDELMISDMNVFVYRNGIVEHREYFPSSPSTLSLSLVKGQKYNIYVMANMGELPSFQREEDFKRSCSYAVNSVSDLGDELPMAWSRPGMMVYDGMGHVKVELERLAAKIVFSLDKGVLGGLKVTSVSLCNCASVVRPFSPTAGAGSRAESVDEIIEVGDYATDADLMVLNDGGEVVFYTLENCQGVLLPDNGQPSGKLPDGLGDLSELCTYLEVTGQFDNEGLLEGEVKYRFYLGLDAVSNFDVPGNSSICVALQLTGAGLREVSWRVTADVSVRDGYAQGFVQEGLHGVDDLYVGEKVLYRVEVQDEIISYVGGDVSACTIGLDSGDDILEFTPLQGGGNEFTCEITCRKPCADGKIYLYGPDGERLSVLSPVVNVNKPRLVFSEFSSFAEDESVEVIATVPKCIINGKSPKVYLYLTDRQLGNLNSKSAYGFDLQAFDFYIQEAGADAALDGAVTAAFNLGTEVSGGYASAVTLSCVNDGKDIDMASALARAYSKGSLLGVVAEERSVGLSAGCDVCLGIQPITLMLMDNGWAGYHSTQLSLRVDNRSKLPLAIVVYQMVDSNKAWNSASLTEEVTAYVRDQLSLTSMDYITGSVPGHTQSMYVSGTEFECVDGGIFPLEGIETEDIMKSLLYDKKDHDRMYHVIDASAAGCDIDPWDICVVNYLSDGSSYYETVYLSDWKSKGIWLYSNDVLVQSAGNYLQHFPNLAPLKIRRMKQRYDSAPLLGLTLWYDDGVFRGYTPYAQGVAYGLTMTVRWRGTVQGYVRTDPKGILGKEVDNYCSATFDKTIKGIPLTGFLDYTSLDDGTVKAAMDAVYAQTFEDKKDGDKFQHSAHPVSIECNVDIFIEGESGKELYPMCVSWEDSEVTYHHAQDGVNYTCPMTQSTPRFNMVHVVRN